MTLGGWLRRWTERSPKPREYVALIRLRNRAESIGTWELIRDTVFLIGEDDK